jgi:hydrogenase expression/formation protein HypC
MCLALPAQIISRDGDQAVVDLGGIRKAISVIFTPEVVPGDYVIIHVGYAIGRLDPQEAQRTLALFAEAADGNFPVASSQ